MQQRKSVKVKRVDAKRSKAAKARTLERRRVRAEKRMAVTS
jgi:hypothetical protein